MNPYLDVPFPGPTIDVLFLGKSHLQRHTIDELLHRFGRPLLFIDEDGDRSNVITMMTKDHIVFDKTDTMNRRMKNRWRDTTKRSIIDQYGFTT